MEMVIFKVRITTWTVMDGGEAHGYLDKYQVSLVERNPIFFLVKNNLFEF